MIFKCDVCKKQFRNRNGLYMHLVRVHGIPDNCVSAHIECYEPCGEWLCPLCHLGYTKKDNLKKHLERVHKAETVELDTYLELASPTVSESLEEFKLEFAQLQKEMVR